MVPIGAKTLPAPLVPADVDLRDFGFMPLDITRLFGSRFHAIATDAEWRAGVTLWAKSFHQVPAASIPGDDIELCRLAELGRDLKAWRKVRDVALHGWVKCSDGRLYHPVVAEKANEAWSRKVAQRERTESARRSRLAQKRPVTESVTDHVTGLVTGPPTDSVTDLLTESVTERSTESVTDSKGQGQGQGQREGEVKDPPIPPKGGKRKSGKAEGESITFDAFVSRCKAQRERRIPESDPIHEWAQSVAFPTEFLRIAWVAFREQYEGNPKQYRDWRRVFRTSVKRRWFRLWFVDRDGSFVLTTDGEVMRRRMESVDATRTSASQTEAAADA